jgi:2-polyprenyl-3-methyl-5-hydroxy-6-metoxy-1,4-benzoquinol methylase
MSIEAEQVAAGHAIYTKSVLQAYDFWVLALSNRLLWKCPTRELLRHYDRHVTGNHLDVGVGTGYFLDRCRFPTPTPRIALLDLNSNALQFASKRIARYRPEVYLRNILLPLVIEAGRFDSVAINYLLHCLPGTIESKAVIFDHLKPLMNPDAVLFGSTLLPDGVVLGGLARRLMTFYNEKGIFSNRFDTHESLERALGRRFRQVSIRRLGCAALFAAHA